MVVSKLSCNAEKFKEVHVLGSMRFMEGQSSRIGARSSLQDTQKLMSNWGAHFAFRFMHALVFSHARHNRAGVGPPTPNVSN